MSATFDSVVEPCRTAPKLLQRWSVLPVKISVRGNSRRIGALLRGAALSRLRRVLFCELKAARLQHCVSCGRTVASGHTSTIAVSGYCGSGFLNHLIVEIGPVTWPICVSQALPRHAKRTLFELSAAIGGLASCAIGWRKDPLVCRWCVCACVDWLGKLSFL